MPSTEQPLIATKAALVRPSKDVIERRDERSRRELSVNGVELWHVSILPLRAT
jgi:hypothetical protein